MKTDKPLYPILTKEQVSKLPWNRLKNIMKSVRAVISDIDLHHGYDICETSSPPYQLSALYKSQASRDYAVNEILRPHRAYFAMLKEYSKSLPHHVA